MFVDYYSLLEISYNSSTSDIKIAYREQAIRWHPDKNRRDTTHKMQLINEAKLILLDEEARKRYDIEYLKYKQAENGKKHLKAEPNNRKEYSSPEYKEYNIQDEILASWIKNARRQANQIINDTIDISSIGGKAALQELKFGFGCWIIGLIILGFIYMILTYLNM